MTLPDNWAFSDSSHSPLKNFNDYSNSPDLSPACSILLLGVSPFLLSPFLGNSQIFSFSLPPSPHPFVSATNTQKHFLPRNQLVMLARESDKWFFTLPPVSKSKIENFSPCFVVDYLLQPLLPPLPEDSPDLLTQHSSLALYIYLSLQHQGHSLTDSTLATTAQVGGLHFASPSPLPIHRSHLQPRSRQATGRVLYFHCASIPWELGRSWW